MPTRTQTLAQWLAALSMCNLHGLHAGRAAGREKRGSQPPQRPPASAAPGPASATSLVQGKWDSHLHASMSCMLMWRLGAPIGSGLVGFTRYVGLHPPSTWNSSCRAARCGRACWWANQAGHAHWGQAPSVPQEQPPFYSRPPASTHVSACRLAMLCTHSTIAQPLIWPAFATLHLQTHVCGFQAWAAV